MTAFQDYTMITGYPQWPLREIHLMKTRAAISKALEPVRAEIYSIPNAAMPLTGYGLPHNLHAAAIGAILREEAMTLT